MARPLDGLWRAVEALDDLPRWVYLGAVAAAVLAILAL